MGAEKNVSLGFIGAGRYNNRVVAVKQVTSTMDFAIRDRETLIRLKNVRLAPADLSRAGHVLKKWWMQLAEIQFDNLTSFYGLSLDWGERILILWDLGKKGSLFVSGSLVSTMFLRLH